MLGSLTSPPLAMRWRWLDRPAAARRVLTLVFLVLVNWLLFAPSKTFEEVHIIIAYQDKLAHFGIFFVLTGLVRWSVPGLWGTGWMRVILILAMVGYCLGTECLQPLIPGAGRCFEWLDLLMDGLGVAAGLWLCERLARQVAGVMSAPLSVVFGREEEDEEINANIERFTSEE